jgi:NitT/TauT family transport system ATP-binding protein
MKQRVGLARALAIDPTYLFMDEPFGALDPQIREMMQIELMKIWDPAHVPAKAGPVLDPGREPARRREHAQGEIRKTVLFVTHSVDEAVFLSDRIVMLGGQPGRVIADIAIDLPRPRWRDEEALKRSPQFVDYRHTIWHMLKQQLGTMAEPIAVTPNGD